MTVSGVSSSYASAAYGSLQRPPQYQQPAQVSQQAQGAYSVSLSSQAQELAAAQTQQLASGGDPRAPETTEVPAQQASGAVFGMY